MAHRLIRTTALAAVAVTAAITLSGTPAFADTTTSTTRTVTANTSPNPLTAPIPSDFIVGTALTITNATSHPIDVAGPAAGTGQATTIAPGASIVTTNATNSGRDIDTSDIYFPATGHHTSFDVALNTGNISSTVTVDRHAHTLHRGGRAEAVCGPHAVTAARDSHDTVRPRHEWIDGLRTTAATVILTVTR